MADNEQILELYFPYKGIELNLAYTKQPVMTTPIMANCRVRDASENMARGGQRSGTEKAFAEQVGGDHPVLKILEVNTTYMSSV